MPNPLGLNAGRPEKYDPKKTPKQAKMAAECGWTDEKIAAVLCIAVSTLYDWKSKYPKFSEAIDEGRNNTPMKVVKALGMRAQGIRFTETTEVWAEAETVKDWVPDPEKPGEFKEVERLIPRRVVETKVVKKFIPPETAAMKYILNNRDPEHWKEATHIDHTSAGKNLNAPALDLSKLTDEEIELLARLEEKAKPGTI